MDPVRRPVASSAESLCLHKGFQQPGSAAVATLPIDRELACALRQNLARQPRHSAGNSVRSCLVFLQPLTFPGGCSFHRLKLVDLNHPIRTLLTLAYFGGFSIVHALAVE